MNSYPDCSPKLWNKVKETIKTSLIFSVLHIYTDFFLCCTVLTCKSNKSPSGINLILVKYAMKYFEFYPQKAKFSLKHFSFGPKIRLELNVSF